MPSSGAGTLLYDPHCTLCTRFARLAGTLARGRLEVVGIHVGIEAGMLDGLTDTEAWATMHHVAPDGTVRSGPDGVAPVVATFPGGGLLVSMLQRIPGTRRANERVYHWLAGRRSSECLPDGSPAEG